MALIETNFIRPQEVYDRNTGESKVRYRSYDGNDRFIPVLEGENGVPKTMVEVTHTKLKEMRDAGKLTPGALYRITDYNCTTTQDNTRSAGHQFDIVLLALSADKLAEEGWAMMHDGVDMFDDYDIYTITFNDGVSKQVYYKIIPNSGGSADTEYRLVDTETFLGKSIWRNPAQDGFVINTENKTATNAYISSTEFESYLHTQYSYNYFQNSNLSAWKVWYCLDNDTNRFAWADDSMDESTLASIYLHNRKGWDDTFIRDESNDITVNNISYYAWYNSNRDARYYTDILIPTTDEKVYFYNDDDEPHSMDIVNGFSIVSYTPAHEGTGLPNGRGVIYRLIDEWNNDVPYDFKNVLYLRKVTDGAIDAQGTDTYIPTFCLYDIGNNEYKDASIFAIEYPDDEGKARPCNNIFIGSILAIDRSMDSGIYALPQNIILVKVKEDDTGWSSRDITLVNVFMCNFTNFTSHVIYLSSSNKTYVGDNNTIISQGKRVVWENIS